MIASLYIGSKTFTHNGTDADLTVLKKLDGLNDLIQKLKNSTDNIFYVNRDDLLVTRLLQDGSTIGDIISTNRKINRDVFNIFLLLLGVCRQANLNFSDLLEYLNLEDEDNCTALVVFNRIDDLPQSKQVISNIEGWLQFRRYYLGKYSKTADYFITEAGKYFERLTIHPDNKRYIRNFIPSHSHKLVDSLTVLNDHFINDLEQSQKAYPEFLNDFAIKHSIDGASLQGKKSKKFYFIFYKGTDSEFSAYCESHLKIFKDDNNRPIHCRIYFKKPDVEKDDPIIYVGSIGKHL